MFPLQLSHLDLGSIRICVLWGEGQDTFSLGGTVDPNPLKEKACSGIFGLACEPLWGFLIHWWTGLPGSVPHCLRYYCPVTALEICHQPSAYVLQESSTLLGSLQFPMCSGICLSMSSKREFARKIWSEAKHVPGRGNRFTQPFFHACSTSFVPDPGNQSWADWHHATALGGRS